MKTTPAVEMDSVLIILRAISVLVLLVFLAEIVKLVSTSPRMGVTFRTYILFSLFSFAAACLR